MPPPRTIDLVALAKGTFKRLAWAYGCSKVGSAEEAVLERMLRDRVLAEAGIERLRPYADDVSVESHFPDLAAIIAALIDPSTAPR